MIKNNREELKQFRKRVEPNSEPSASNECYRNEQDKNKYTAELQNDRGKVKL